MPDAYRILILPSAQPELKTIRQPLLGRIADAISSLGSDPRPRGCKKLVGSDSDYRIRIGDYRVLYDVNDVDRKLNVYRIKHRKDAYL